MLAARRGGGISNNALAAWSGDSHVNETAVLDACDRLVDFHAWDAHKIDARGWMRNFQATERSMAAELLSRFAFYAGFG